MTTGSGSAERVDDSLSFRKPCAKNRTMTTPKMKRLRRQAIAVSLFPPTTLRRALARMGFVQADPIRAPARAQDLILRHRVRNYRVGDLERDYHRLGLEEDRFYAHGFMPRSIWRLLHPRIERPLSEMEKRVLDLAATLKRIHPADLETHLGRSVATNAWGGKSKETTLALHSLHRRGLLRIAGRQQGIRTYEPVTSVTDPLDLDERCRQIVLAIASILGPHSERSLRTSLTYLGHRGPGQKALRAAVPTLIDSGELAQTTVEGVRYVWRAGRVARSGPTESVRFLSPFDPLVWDRRRFEEFWGWQYRFEAYVPARKRKLGYYAMPLLWRDDMIGWVNATFKGGKLKVEAGFRKSEPRESAFRAEFEAEVARLQAFLETGLTRPNSPRATGSSATMR
jgi:uncharacterized protein